MRSEGIEQWVTIEGVRCDNPVILMAHGRPGSPNTVNSVLTVDQLTRDGIAVAEWVTQRLGQKKVNLMDSSWGSTLGVHMAKRRPALFQTYVGTVQLISQRPP